MTVILKALLRVANRIPEKAIFHSSIQRSKRRPIRSPLFIYNYCSTVLDFYGDFESYGWKWETAPVNNWESYYAKYLKVSGLDIRLNPFHLLYGGNVSSGSLNSAGTEGIYWDSTMYNVDDVYHLYFNSSNVYPSSNGHRYRGFFIRCLAR